MHRRLRLSYYHSTHKKTGECSMTNINNNITPLVTPKSMTDFRKSNNESLEKLLDMHRKNCLQQNQTAQLDPILFKNVKIAKELGTRLHSQKMIITLADKGSCLIIMQKGDYEVLINRHLNDITTYIKCNKSEENEILNQIVGLSNSFSDCFIAGEKLFISDENFRSSVFYVLPKIHKCDTILNEIKNNQGAVLTLSATPPDLTSRPIVSNVNSVTSGLSKLLDRILRPLLNVVPSYIKDNYHFLEYLPRNINSSTILITWDIVSLYTNIDESLGLEAISYWLDNFDFAHIYKRFSKNFILSAVKIVLSGNIFVRGKQYYRQVKGTAMGTNFAPTYAILTIGYLESLFYKQCVSHFSSPVTEYIISNFKRYIDDCIIIWDPTFGDYNILHNLLNNLHASITYTMSTSTTSTPFLDILLVKENNRLETEIYTKPTDNDSILHFSSCHNRQIKRSIPYSLAIRINRIVSVENKRIIFFNQLKIRLQKYGYPVSLIDDAIKRAQSNTNTIHRTNTNHTSFLLHFSSGKNKASSQTHSLFQNLLLDNTTKMIFNESQPIVSFYNCPNILHYLKSAPPRIMQCNKPRCGTCKIITPGTTINLPNRQLFHPNTTMSCISEHVIYCLICPVCSKIYIGSTSLKLTKRITLHRSQTRHRQYTILHVNFHFSTCSNNEFNVVPIYRLQNHTHESVLLFVENYFIHMLKPELNSN